MKNKINNTDELYSKGVKLLRRGKYQEAIECFDKVLEIDPNHADALTNKAGALNNMGVALQKQGWYQEAMNYYNKALKIIPDFDIALRNAQIAQCVLIEQYDQQRRAATNIN
jgi:tetratricopeptide (TPR) repeat protein